MRRRQSTALLFLPIARLLAAKRRLVPHLHPRYHRLARVMPVFLNSTTSEYRAGWAQAITVHYASCKSTRASATIRTAASCDAVHTHTGAMACEPLFCTVGAYGFG